MSHLSAISLRAVLLSLCFLPVVTSAAIWQDMDATIAQRGVDAEPVYYRALRADKDALKQALAAAPLEFTSSQGAELLLPMPDGSMQRFEVENSPIMAPELAARYPEIQTYRVRGVDDPTATGRLDMTPKGFHGMILSAAGTVFIDPDQAGGYRSYTKKAYASAKKAVFEDQSTPRCLVEEELESAQRSSMELALRTSDSLREYRLAVAATGEYTQFHGGVSAASAEIDTAINRVSAVYERDLAIRFVLVADNDLLISSDPTSDPYTDINNLTNMLSENQANLDAVIGSANYDIGHVFSTAGGGLAVVGATCINDRKAKGVTGMSQPIGDAFYIDLVAHEMGHQFDAVHSFNGTTDNCAGVNRVADSAVEPGSGSTIMAYAGICGAENLQLHTDATFHAKGIEEILIYTVSGSGASCGNLTSTGNSAPTVSAGIDRTIPLCTPFILNGSASDGDLDTLNYQWDEMDIGAATDATTFGTDLGSNPLFRSYTPKDTEERVLPRMSALTKGTSDKGETLPAAARTMNFRLTARDGNGGVNEDDMQVTVDSTMGPFRVSGGVLNGGGGFLPGSQQTIEWSVGNTDAACPQVAISLLAYNATGTSYCDESNDPVLDLGEFANIGSATLTLPDLSIAKGRVKVACASNIYFSLSEGDIQLQGTVAISTSCKSADLLSLDGTGDLVEACRVQIGDVPLPTADTSDSGGGGALFLLPALLGFRFAGRTLKRARRPSA